jgi:hypothetical protein
VANTLWAYATMGREPGAGVMREVEGRAEALAGTFNAQDVANTTRMFENLLGAEGSTLKQPNIFMKSSTSRSIASSGTRSSSSRR